MLVARGELLLMADADAATRFRDVELLEKAMAEARSKNLAAVVVGSRAHLQQDAVVKVLPFVAPLSRAIVRS
jgi:dolichyl-phosphate beta-glucosyltransferase